MTNEEAIVTIKRIEIMVGYNTKEYEALELAIKALKNEPKKGKWIDVNGDGSLWKCSNCGETSCCRGKYCSDCRADMREAE